MNVIDGKEEMPPEWVPTAEKLREDSPEYDDKRKVLDLFETTNVTTLSEAAEKLNFSKYRVYKWKRNDSEFAQELQIAKELVADRLEQELLTCEKYHEAFARIFLLNGLRPNVYKHNKFVIENPKFEKLLQDIKKAGKKEPDASNDS